MRTRISEIDLLRFMAAVAVMLMHYLLRGFAINDHYSPMHFPSLGPFTRYNYLAVDLFFIISGFMILMSVHVKNKQLISPKGFILSRFLRLFPAYWFCCTLSFILVFFLINDIIHISLARYIINMTMFNGFFFIGTVDGVYWTLCIELKFYLLMLLLLYSKHIPLIQRYLLIWTLISLFNFWIDNPLLKYLFITDYAPFFISGCLFYLNHKDGFCWSRNLLIGINFILVFLYEKNVIEWKLTHFLTLTYFPETIFIILVSFYGSFFAILKIQNVSKSYDNFFSYLGRLSYPLYLIHLNVGMVIFNLLNNYVNWYLLLVLTCLLMILLAHLISTFIEKPFAKFLKQKLSPWANS
jgi:peptidoglycan/LPS O-acetylase OafA/YrhL